MVTVRHVHAHGLWECSFRMVDKSFDLGGYSRNELIALAQDCETAIADAFLKALGAKRHKRKRPRRQYKDRRYKHAKKLMKQRYGVRM